MERSVIKSLIVRVEDRHASEPREDALAAEEPLEIQLGYERRGWRVHKSVSVTMRTPGADAELAAGFLFTEGILASGAQIETVREEGENVMRVELKAGVEVDLRRLERHFYTASSCGVCGKASIAALNLNTRQARPGPGPVFDAAVIHDFPATLRATQAVFDRTGGLHAAALFDPAGRLRGLARGTWGGTTPSTSSSVRKSWRDATLPLDTCGLFVSGRASFELVQKALAAGLPLLAAVGAPSSLAVELAQAHGMTLLGFRARRGGSTSTRAKNASARWGTANRTTVPMCGPFCRRRRGLPARFESFSHGHPYHPPTGPRAFQRSGARAGPRHRRAKADAHRHRGQEIPAHRGGGPRGRAGRSRWRKPKGPRSGTSTGSRRGIPAVYQSARFTIREMGLVRGIKTWLEVNKKGGFDCQSCAWPSPDEGRHIFEFCENGVKAVADEATRRSIAGDFFAQHSVADLQAKSDLWLGQQGRLTRPMVKREDATHYEEISWDDAFRLMADELRALPTPDAAAFYTSGRTSNEAAFLYQLFVRQFGTNNLPDCSNMCHESSGAALNETIGIGKGCVTLDDFTRTDCVFIIGQNPGTNHPRMMTSLEHAKQHGATIISANPLPETGLMRVVNPNPQEYSNPLKFPVDMLLNKGKALTDIWLPVRINGDLAMLKGILKEMLAEEDKAPGSVFDLEFIREYTVESAGVIADLRTTDWDVILRSSGLTREQIRRTAEAIMKSKSLIVCWAMGLTQHKNAVATIQYAMNLLLFGGHIGRAGAGPCPVRGHSNVQGDRTMGIWERMNDGFMDKLGKVFAFEPPKPHGVDAVECVKGMHRGEIQFFLGMGGNFLSAMSDTNYTAAALQKCRLTAHASIKLNRSHLITGKVALILPCLGRSEKDHQKSGLQFVTVEDSMGIVNPSRGSLEPHGAHQKSEVAVVCGLARATLGSRTTTDWQAFEDDYDLIRESIEAVIPGFEDFNARIRRNVFYLPNDARDHRKFNNGIGKAKFITASIEEHSLEPGQYVMMSIRSHDQFNTHIYGLDDRYRGIYNGRRVIFMHPEDVRAAGLQQGQLVDLTGHYEGEKRSARHFMVTPYDIPRGCTATYYPETNVLVPINSNAERSNTPTSKFIVISVAPSPDADLAVNKIISGARETTTHEPAALTAK